MNIKNLALLFLTFSFQLNYSNDSKVIWSILIPTLEKRKKDFLYIYNKLMSQIKDNKLENAIEIVVLSDNGEMSIGTKRNKLLNMSKGEYTCFFDDDDDAHPEYISMIYNKIISEKPDCVSLVGIITFDGKNPKKFIHSLKYNSYFEKDNVYYRPPNHLNVIRKDVAIIFKFPEKSYGEDTDWAMRVCRSGLLKTEAIINEPYYFYLFNSVKKTMDLGTE